MSIIDISQIGYSSKKKMINKWQLTDVEKIDYAGTSSLHPSVHMPLVGEPLVAERKKDITNIISALRRF